MVLLVTVDKVKVTVDISLDEVLGNIGKYFTPQRDDVKGIAFRGISYSLKDYSTKKLKEIGIDEKSIIVVFMNKKIINEPPKEQPFQPAPIYHARDNIINIDDSDETENDIPQDILQNIPQDVQQEIQQDIQNIHRIMEMFNIDDVTLVGSVYLSCGRDADATAESLVRMGLTQ